MLQALLTNTGLTDLADKLGGFWAQSLLGGERESAVRRESTWKPSTLCRVTEFCLEALPTVAVNSRILHTEYSWAPAASIRRSIDPFHIYGFLRSGSRHSWVKLDSSK